jgi:hypothetical protein
MKGRANDGWVEGKLLRKTVRWKIEKMIVGWKANKRIVDGRKSVE